MVRIQGFHCCGLNSVPGQGTKILQPHGSAKKKRGKYRLILLLNRDVKVSNNIVAKQTQWHIKGVTLSQSQVHFRELKVFPYYETSKYESWYLKS